MAHKQKPIVLLFVFFLFQSCTVRSFVDGPGNLLIGCVSNQYDIEKISSELKKYVKNHVQPLPSNDSYHNEIYTIENKNYPRDKVYKTGKEYLVKNKINSDCDNKQNISHIYL